MLVLEYKCFFLFLKTFSDCKDFHNQAKLGRVFVINTEINLLAVFEPVARPWIHLYRSIAYNLV